jgi:adenosine deaminase
MRQWSTMPKVELHLHLEGAIPLPTLWEIIEGHGGDDTMRAEADLADFFAYRDFDHFIDTWTWMIGFLRRYEDFTHGAEAVARSLAEQNIVYAEAFFSPSDFRDHGLDPGGLAKAIRTGLDRVPGVEVALIVDLVRDRGPASAATTFAAISEVAEETGVIGVGIGGHEAEYPPELFAGVYRTARQAGFQVTAHAGEAAGPASVWGAVTALEVERIGHGVRSVEDPRLIDYLVERQIPLEVCPTSNVRTGVVPGWDTHPARHLIESGAMVTLNTDDPTLFHTTLAREYQAVENHFSLDESDLRRISCAAIEASWAPEPTKVALAQQLSEWWERSTDSCV